MKKILFILSAVLLTFSVGAQDLPSTTIKQLNGRPIKFNKIFKEGRVTLVSFWATWCVPCKAEIKNIKDKMPDWKAEADFDFVTVSIDDSRAAALVKSYTKSQGWDWPVYLDQNSDLKRSLNFQNVPFTMIVDANGKVVFQHTGYEEGGEDEVFEVIKKHAVKNPTDMEAPEEARKRINKMKAGKVDGKASAPTNIKETAVEKAVEAVEEAADAVEEAVE